MDDEELDEALLELKEKTGDAIIRISKVCDADDGLDITYQERIGDSWSGEKIYKFRKKS